MLSWKEWKAVTLVSDQVLWLSQVMNQNVKSGDRQKEAVAGRGGATQPSKKSVQ